MHSSPGLHPAGFHVYDGHNHQESLVEGGGSVRTQSNRSGVARKLEKGLPVPRIVAGGTPTFPISGQPGPARPGMFAGNAHLHNNGYGSRFPDLVGFTPAALLLSRVISRPTPTRFTLDLGYKAVATDPPAGKRCVLLDVPDYKAVRKTRSIWSSKHPTPRRYRPGEKCTPSPRILSDPAAMHRKAYVVEDGKVIGTWEIAARDRMLTV